MRTALRRLLGGVLILLCLTLLAAGAGLVAVTRGDMGWARDVRWAATGLASRIAKAGRMSMRMPPF